MCDERTSLRDRLVVRAATAVLYLASRRTRARIQLRIVQSLGGEPSARLLRDARLSRGPGA
jgi:hypothetical protein